MLWEMAGDASPEGTGYPRHARAIPSFQNSRVCLGGLLQFSGSGRGLQGPSSYLSLWWEILAVLGRGDGTLVLCHLKCCRGQM